MKKKLSWMLTAVLLAGLLAVPAMAAKVPGSNGRLNASAEPLGTTTYEGTTLDGEPGVFTAYVYPAGTTFSWTDEESTDEQFYSADTFVLQTFETSCTPENDGVYAFEVYTFATQQSQVTYVMIGSGEDVETQPETQPETQQPAVGAFTDVPENAYYAQPVAWAVEQKITNGTSDTTFSPGVTCNRSEIITFLWRAAGCPVPVEANPYIDVGPDNFYTDPAIWAYEQGMAGEGVFDPQAPCTRAMAVEFMWKQAGSPAPTASASFTDVDADASYAQAVAWAVEQQITNGTGDGTTFSPDATCTRGEIVTFLWRALAQ